MASNEPFFILGCVRSGTTMLRDLLKSVPRLACPEETQFYRWGDPFGGPVFMNTVTKNKVLQKHRAIDGVSEEAFAEVLAGARTRRELSERYVAAFVAARGLGAVRWFDKSPQNIYGLALLADEFPEAKIVHIVRNPLNVVASLAVGKVMLLENTVGAANYWREAVAIFDKVKPSIAGRVHEIAYETLTAEPAAELARLMAFLDEDARDIRFNLSKIHPERDQWRDVLSADAVAVVRDICGPWAKRYGYDLEAATAAAAG